MRRFPSRRPSKRCGVGKKNAETHLEDDLPGSIKLVLGLFTIRQDVAYQQVAKETWMSQSGVCLAEDGPKPGCSVYVAFVLGREPVPEGMEADLTPVLCSCVQKSVLDSVLMTTSKCVQENQIT